MRYLSLFILLTALVSCDIKKSDMSPDANFIRVYSDPVTSNTYFPIDIEETEDGGYIIVSGIYDSTLLSYPKTHLLKTDEFGNVAWTYNENSALSPTPGIIKMENSYYILTMLDNTNNNCSFFEIQIGDSSGSLSNIRNLDIQFPLYCYNDQDNRTIVLSFDNNGKRTVISRFDALFNMDWSYETSAVGGEYFVRYHLNKEGNDLPFFIGSILDNNLVSHYYINCFTNNSLSVLYLDVDGNSTSGRIIGLMDEFNIDEASSNLTPIGFDTIFLARFNTRNNYVYTGIGYDVTTPYSSRDLGKNYTNLPELTSQAKVVTLLDTFNDEELVVFASTTKSNQVVLYFFSTDTHELVRSHYLGHTNPVEIASLKRGTDDALLILGKTWVGGRFQRIIFFKVSMEELGF